MSDKDRMDAYITPTKDGGILVDVEAMLADAVMVMKGTGISRDGCIRIFTRVCDDVEVPEVTKQ